MAGPRPGTVSDRRVFVHGLNRTMARAAAAGDRVFVFRLKGSVKGLQRWNDNDGIPAEVVNRSVEATILAANAELALWRDDGGDLLGFDITGRPPALAERLGGRLMTALSTPLGSAGNQFIFSPRLGVCVFDPATADLHPGQRSDPDTGPAEQAIGAAGETVAQTDFTTPFLIHNPYIAERGARWERIATDMPAALADGSITVAFQPRLEAAGLTVAGVEVLARWQRPDRGPVPTVEFLAVAERDGHLVDLGRRLRARTVELARDWPQRDCKPRLWFNVSALELCHPDVVDSITELAERDPALCLGLEIPDSRLLEDLIFLRIFDRLTEAGVELALDNVNPSGLSFGRLRTLPVSMVNLDGELVRSLPSSAANRDLVRLLSANAAERAMTVTACGVESDEQLQVAKACGVELVQGTGVAEVHSPAEIGRYLAGGTEPTISRSPVQRRP